MSEKGSPLCKKVQTGKSGLHLLLISNFHPQYTPRIPACRFLFRENQQRSRTLTALTASNLQMFQLKAARQIDLANEWCCAVFGHCTTS